MKKETAYSLFSLALGTACVTTSTVQAQEVLPFPPTPSGSVAGRTMQESTYHQLPVQSHLPKGAPIPVTD